MNLLASFFKKAVDRPIEGVIKADEVEDLKLKLEVEEYVLTDEVEQKLENFLPDDLLSTSSVLTKTVEILDADTCKDVEVIGWLYQYFNQDEKDRVQF